MYRIVDGLLSVAEVNILFDKPDACNIKLLEVEKILKEVICDKVKLNFCFEQEGKESNQIKLAFRLDPATKVQRKRLSFLQEQKTLGHLHVSAFP